MIRHLSVEQVLDLHERLNRVFGGAAALRDRGLLESAAARPGATFDGEDLYRDLAAKAAALLESLVVNHAFVDGNKRIGAGAAEWFLELNGARLEASDKDLLDVVMALARGELGAEQLTIWFRQRIVEKD
ncbi:MAG: type II toxin-antitoxin system death-on-curing family toxin [Thermoanaerobaculia bacterium]